jgi:hypothetical protein
MKLIIDVPQEIIEECKEQTALIRQEGEMPYGTNLMLKCIVANALPYRNEREGSEWIQVSSDFPPMCKACGCIYDERENFCPDCGARMSNPKVEPFR